MPVPGAEARFNAQQVLASQHNDEVTEPASDGLDVEQPTISTEKADPNASAYQKAEPSFLENLIKSSPNAKYVR